MPKKRPPRLLDCPQCGEAKVVTDVSNQRLWCDECYAKWPDEYHRLLRARREERARARYHQAKAREGKESRSHEEGRDGRLVVANLKPIELRFEGLPWAHPLCSPLEGMRETF